MLLIYCVIFASVAAFEQNSYIATPYRRHDYTDIQGSFEH